MRVIKRSTVIPELWPIVKVTVVMFCYLEFFIETLIGKDDLNFDRYSETVYDSGHAPPVDLRVLCMLLVSECINCIREGDVKNQKIVII